MIGNKVQLSSLIKKYLEDGDIRAIFKRESNSHTIRTVDFLHEAPASDEFQSSYVLDIADCIPAKTELVCLFPNQSSINQRVLHVTSRMSLSKLNKTINERIKTSLDETEAGRIKFAVAFGNCIFSCMDICGTAYIQWATYINRIKGGGNEANTQYREWPVVFNYDGQYKPKAIFVLKSTVSDSFYDTRIMPMAYNNPVLLLPKLPIFVCETPPEAAPKRQLQTITRNEATTLSTMTTNDVLNWLPYQKNPLAASGAREGEIMDGNSGDDQSVSISMESPRGPAVQLQISRLKHSIPPDPFKEEEGF